MIQSGEHARFALKAGHSAFRIVHEIGGKNFDGYVARERRVMRAVYLSHPAGADRGLDFVRSAALALGDCHALQSNHEPPEYTFVLSEWHICKFLMASGFGQVSAGFGLWFLADTGSRLAATKTHRLKPAPPGSLAHLMGRDG